MIFFGVPSFVIVHTLRSNRAWIKCMCWNARILFPIEFHVFGNFFAWRLALSSVFSQSSLSVKTSEELAPAFTLQRHSLEWVTLKRVFCRSTLCAAYFWPAHSFEPLPKNSVEWRVIFNEQLHRMYQRWRHTNKCVGIMACDCKVSRARVACLDWASVVVWSQTFSAWHCRRKQCFPETHSGSITHSTPSWIWSKTRSIARANLMLSSWELSRTSSQLLEGVEINTTCQQTSKKHMYLVQSYKIIFSLHKI